MEKGKLPKQSVLILEGDGLHVVECPISEKLISVQIANGYPIRLRCEDIRQREPEIGNSNSYCIYNSAKQQDECLFNYFFNLTEPSRDNIRKPRN